MTIRSNLCFEKEPECKGTIQANCFYGCIYKNKPSEKEITLLITDSFPWLEKEM